MTLDLWEFVGEFKMLNLRFRAEDGALSRECRQPGSAVDDLPEEVQAAAREAWTVDVVEAYATSGIPTFKRTVPKSVIVSRLIAAEKIGAAYQALNSNPEYWARWVASDRPAINYDDPDALALLRAIGADPDVILAP